MANRSRSVTNAPSEVAEGPNVPDREQRPNPGSDEALALGCTCPVLDNGHGNPELGRTRGWWITQGCPVHAPEKEEGS